MDVLECDLVDVQGLSKYKDGIKYLLSVIDVFSKYLHAVPLKSKTGPSVTAAFQSVLKDRQYSNPVRRRPVCLQADSGKEFSNRPFQDMLKREGNQFYVCRNPDVKCAVVERTRRTLRNKLYRYFTYMNTFRFVNVLQQFVKAYNTVHTGHGMAAVAVTDKHNERQEVSRACGKS
jgi:transposase InsO family protein